jgi:endonuclease YncB( thermonuclease family)
MTQYIIPAIALLIAVGFFLNLFHPSQPDSFSGSAYVIDGDTLAFGDVRVRLFGIDTPEMDQSQGQASKAAMINLVRGQELEVRTVDTDNYGRLIAKVYLPNGDDLAKVMVEQGYARAYTYFSKAYVGAERYARRSQSGLWADGEVQSGAEWRQAN